tara:strand:- start:35 stop:274 length:240 start_codon:yes stop_codon:yes gene_type:complete
MSNTKESEELFRKPDPPLTDKEREEILKRAESEGEQEALDAEEGKKKKGKEKKPKGFKKGGKVRGVRIAKKGFRPAKMR